jgi:AbrB family looped-hinge helix DNA binding protein
MESLVKVDSKGRMLIPSSMRKKLRINNGTELVLMHGKEDNLLRIMPLSNGKIVKCSVSVSNSPGSLSSVMEMLEMLNAGVMMSESRKFIGKDVSEWTFILDVSKLSGQPEALEEKLSMLECVKSVDIAR